MRYIKYFLFIFIIIVSFMSNILDIAFYSTQNFYDDLNLDYGEKDYDLNYAIIVDKDFIVKIISTYDVLLVSYDNNRTTVYVGPNIKCNEFSVLNEDCSFELSNKTNRSVNVLNESIFGEVEIRNYTSNVDNHTLTHFKVKDEQLYDVIETANKHGFTLSESDFRENVSFTYNQLHDYVSEIETDISILVITLGVVLALVIIIEIKQSKKAMMVKLLNGYNYRNLSIEYVKSEFMRTLLISILTIIVLFIFVIYVFSLLQGINFILQSVRDILLIFFGYLLTVLILFYVIIYSKLDNMTNYITFNLKSYVIVVGSFILTSHVFLINISYTEILEDSIRTYNSYKFNISMSRVGPSIDYDKIESSNIASIAAEVITDENIYLMSEQYARLFYDINVDVTTLLSPKLCKSDLGTISVKNSLKSTRLNIYALYYKLNGLNTESLCYVVLDNNDFLNYLDNYKIDFPISGVFYKVNENSELVISRYFNDILINITRIISKLVILITYTFILILCSIIGFKMYIYDYYRKIFNVLIVKKIIIGVPYIIAKYCILSSVILLTKHDSIFVGESLIMINIVTDLTLLTYYNIVFKRNLLKLKNYR